MSYLRLAGGQVFDPANGSSGEIADIWIRDGKIVNPPQEPASMDYRSIDVSGRVVMPGGVDMHCHIAGPKVNTARKMQPEQFRQFELGLPNDGMASVPTIWETGIRYAGMGYTTCFDAAISPLGARHVHHEFGDIPNVDTGFFILVGNNHYALERIAKGDREGLRHFLSWLINRVGSYAPKIVNPGGVVNWKQNRQGNARDLDQPIDGFDLSPRKILSSITEAANELELPHPVHIHTNNLGMPGNWETTLETMKSLDGHRAHLAHIQFHSYGGGGADATSINSQVRPLAEYVNNHRELTVDVAQVVFGRTISMTGDAPLGYFLQKISGERWYSADTEWESGCGISPIEYRDKNFVDALQWAIGLEWYLSVHDPWQVVMSTDHPNGGSFLAYPQIIRLLMDRDYRNERLGTVHPRVLENSTLPDLDREYSLEEIAIITRAGPARILGLKHKGHLGVGADADICVYTPDPNYETMFQLPYLVIKGGEILIQEGEIRQTVTGQSICVRPDSDLDRNRNVEAWFEDHYSISASNYGMPDHLERSVVDGSV